MQHEIPDNALPDIIHFHDGLVVHQNKLTLIMMDALSDEEVPKASVNVTYKSLLKSDASPEAKQSRFDFLYKMANISQKARQEQHEQAKVKREYDPQCTFKPTIQANYQSQKSEHSLKFYDRQRLWEENRKQKLEEKRGKDVDKDLVGCTFQPDIRIPRKPEDSPEPKDVHISERAIQSLEQFLKRQIVARQHKLEKQILLNNPYSHLSAEKRGVIGRETSNITHSYESRKNAEKIEFSKIVSSADKYPEFTPPKERYSPSKSHEPKVSLGTAIKLLHQELHNINFTTQFG